MWKIKACCGLNGMLEVSGFFYKATSPISPPSCPMKSHAQVLSSSIPSHHSPSRSKQTPPSSLLDSQPTHPPSSPLTTLPTPPRLPRTSSRPKPACLNPNPQSPILQPPPRIPSHPILSRAVLSGPAPAAPSLPARPHAQSRRRAAVPRGVSTPRDDPARGFVSPQATTALVRGRMRLGRCYVLQLLGGTPNLQWVDGVGAREGLRSATVDVCVDSVWTYGGWVDVWMYGV